eukprot:3202876-Lingulodinium_polyedra.AAC.1
MPGQRGADKHATKCAKLPWPLSTTVVRDFDRLVESIRAADAQSAASAAAAGADQPMSPERSAGPAGSTSASSGLNRPGHPSGEAATPPATAAA